MTSKCTPPYIVSDDRNTNILHWIAHFQGQVKIEARLRPNARGRGQLVEAETEAEAKI